MLDSRIIDLTFNKIFLKLVVGEDGKALCRIVLVPEFASTGVLVLVNLRTLEVKTRTFATAT